MMGQQAERWERKLRARAEAAERRVEELEHEKERWKSLAKTAEAIGLSEGELAPGRASTYAEGKSGNPSVPLAESECTCIRGKYQLGMRTQGPWTNPNCPIHE
jgi:hypothetical protein